MGQTLASYAIRLLESEPRLSAALEVPLLVWADAEVLAEEDQDRVFQTRGGGALDRPQAGEPVVFELRKQTTKVNPFLMGITVGRNDNNDIVLDDPSISRFHAYFQQDARSGGWKLVDAESRNGTWVAPLKLAGNISQPVGDRGLIRFGDLTMRFLLPGTFLEYLKLQMESSGPVEIR